MLTLPHYGTREQRSRFALTKALGLFIQRQTIDFFPEKVVITKYKCYLILIGDSEIYI